MNLKSISKIEILDIPFAAGSLEELSEAALSGRGLVTAPSAPCLAIAIDDPTYTKQLNESALTIPDSGAMALAWNLFCPKDPVTRVSGLALLKRILKDLRIRKSGALFLVDPSDAASARNRHWLSNRAINVSETMQYVAPIYPHDSVEDLKLLDLLLEKRPRYVLINLGGGIQERLGAWLQREWRRRSGDSDLPTIICTGAAIAFLTGEQVSIPRWSDHFYLGWAVRCVAGPARFVPRYFNSLPVLYYIAKDALKRRRSRAR